MMGFYSYDGRVKPKKRSRPRSEPSVRSHDETDMRLNVTVPVAVHQRVKVKAAENRQTIRQYILGLLERDGIKMA